MELSRRCKEYWGISSSVTPFGEHIEAVEGLFIWPEFSGVVDRIVHAIKRRQFLIVVGTACSAKTTAWAEAIRPGRPYIEAARTGRISQIQ